jgi:hypothetical protein
VLVRELNLWASSCMVAMEGDEPLGVLLAAKRERQGQTLIHRIGVRPDQTRKGHGRHLMTSLSSKLAILGPPRLAAEVPADREDLRAFFEACGYAPEAMFTDFTRETLEGPAAGTAALVAPVTLEDLTEAGLVADVPARSWERHAMTLAGRAANLRGVGIATDRGYEAWALWRDLPSGEVREIAALGCAPGGQGRALLSMLMPHIAAGSRRLIVPRLSEDEMDGGQLEAWGFTRERSWIRYAAEARA